MEVFFKECGVLIVEVLVWCGVKVLVIVCNMVMVVVVEVIWVVIDLLVVVLEFGVKLVVGLSCSGVIGVLVMMWILFSECF